MRSCAAPAADQPEVCAPADLHTGDGEAIELGLLCAPTPFTWRSQQRVKLASHRYRDDGAHTAILHWGEATAEVTVAPEMFARDIAGQPAIEWPGEWAKLVSDGRRRLGGGKQRDHHGAVRAARRGIGGRYATPLLRHPLHCLQRLAEGS